MLKKIRLSVLVALLLMLPVLGHAQAATFNYTTLTTAITDANPITVYVASPVGFVVNAFAVVDQEVMRIQAISLTGGITKITATRGQLGTRATSHAAGSVVMVGSNYGFTTVDKNAGATCTIANELILPIVNTVNGNIWDCRSNGTNVVWILRNSSYQFHIQTATTATPGTYRVIRGEITTFATMTSGNLVGVRGAVILPSNGVVSGGYLWGTQGKIIMGAGSTFSGTDMVGVYGQLDVTGATVSGGHVAPVSGNIFGFNSGSNAFLNLVYVEAAGGGVINSIYQSFAKANYVFDIGTNVHAPEAASTGTPGTCGGASGYIHVLIDGVARNIELCTP